MVTNPFLDKARKFEEAAFDIANKYKIGLKTKEDVMKAYLNAADQYLKINYLDRARSNYNDALKNASTKEEKQKIEEKIEELIANVGKIGNLEKKFNFVILPLSFLIIALCFSVFSLTGYTIGNSTYDSSRAWGVLFFILGLIFSFVYFKFKKYK